MCPSKMLGISIYTHHLISRERCHLNLLTVYRVGRKLARAIVLSPRVLYRNGIPHTADARNHLTGCHTIHKSTVGLRNKCRTLCYIQQRLRHINTFNRPLRTVPTAMVCDTVIIDAKIKSRISKE